MVVSSQHDRADIVGGEELFRKRVFQWFAVMWAVMFAAAANIPGLQGIRAQLLFNLIAVFAGSSLLIIWRYNLDVRKIIGFRRQPWSVWIAVLMAVPAAQVVARAFFELVNTVIPTRDVMLRELSRQMGPVVIPPWQIYVLVAILPAVCEEFAFRGILLQGLKNRFHPIVRCLAVGIIFGLFHYTLFRIAPTAFLGVILTAIAMMTGSILPGMLFHAANNAFAIWAQTSGNIASRLDWAVYATAFAVFGLAMQVIYRNGSRNRA
jgi:sodium transport system permease protein